MLVPAVALPAAPAITPPPDLARAVYGGYLARRQLDMGGDGLGLGGDIGDSCLYGAGYDLNGMQECNSMIYSCATDAYADFDAAKDCYCNYGMGFLDCYYDKLGTCAPVMFGTGDWREYQLSFFTSYCGTIPPSAFAQIEPPSTVSLSFTKAKIVTTPGRIAIPTGVEPQYKGSGQLLSGPCSASTDYTLVNAGSTVYAAGVVGCNGNRPECCPFKVGEMGSAPGAAGSPSEDQNKNRVGIDFPKPAESAQAILTGCAQDYYSVSGGCCPVGFWPFTAAVGGQTPCYSSVNRMTVGAVTVGADDEKDKDTAKPTSAVANIIWSMRYQVEDSGSGGLSTAAKAGIGAGVGIVAIAAIAVGAWFFLRSRKNKTSTGEKVEAPAAGAAAVVAPQADPLPPKQPEQLIQQQQMMPPQQPGFYGPPGGQFPPPGQQYAPGTVFMPAPGAPQQPPSDQMSYTTATHMSAVSAPSTLLPQNTGASAGTAPSELSAQYYAYAGTPQQGIPQQQPGSPQPQQIQPVPVPGTVPSPSPPPQGQYQQFSPPQQTGPISPQELQAHHQQLPPQQMVWDQNAGGYVLPQQQAQQFYPPQQQPPQQQPPQ